MKKVLEDALTKTALSDLARQIIYERGEDYYDAGAVSGLRLIGGKLRARVAGTDDYEVSLWHDEAGLGYDCSCPMGLGGECCKHVVAAGLAWLGKQGKEKQGKGKQGKKAIRDETQPLRDFLLEQSRETLVE
jgi:uncharacterized Zn finger protein